ncbi:VacJ family lipoprotein [Novosphingobium sp. NBM11]|nr:VacJ family lipoprotein [Novosphingobium sp. NBM11]
MRSGLRNALSNLTEPFIFVNFLLQGKPGKAVETLGRFVVNSTFGVGGLFDVAKTKDFKLPHRPNGFGTTLAFYGVGPGPYIFLPFIGPTTLRDLLGNSADDALLPLVAGKPFNSMEYQLITGGIGGLDLRAESDADLRALFDGAVDPYATLRSVYLQNRAAEVEEAKGHAATAPQQAAPELTDPLNDPELTGTQPEPPAPQSDAPELRDPLDDPEATPAPQP